MEFKMLRVLIVTGLILFAIILTEALTQIITKSEIFRPIRKFFFTKRENRFFNWFHDLLDCGYCTSVWVGWFVAICMIVVNDIVLNAFFAGIVLHRLSNVLHFVIDRIDRNSI
jgi:hypothetical protein